MRELIDEINTKLKEIINDLIKKRIEVSDALNSVQERIDDKIEEAKGYKNNVDAAKDSIRLFESEIDSLQSDLDELTARFSNKDLNAILEAANREISNKISIREKEIAKQREKISELTEKARTIKDLLINLKKDKETKKTRLDNLNDVIYYYEQELNRIIDYSEANPDSLVYVPEEPISFNPYDNDEEISLDSPVFDEIENIDKTEEEASNDDEDDDVLVLKSDEETKKVQNDIVDDMLSNKENAKKTFENDEEELQETSKEEPLKSEVKEEKEPVLFEHDKTEKIDFKTLNDSINKEYENIFGSSEEISIPDDTALFSMKSEDNVFDNPSFEEEQEPVKKDANETMDNTVTTNVPSNFDDLMNSLNEDILNTPVKDDTGIDVFGSSSGTKKYSYDKGSENDDFVRNFFTTNKIDYDKFSTEEQNYLKQIFNPIGFSKILDVLKRNNISLNFIYGASKIFEMPYNELETIINKLLLAGQTTQNISYVLSTLPLINSIDLGEVINSYGKDAKNTDIADIIVKAKHLNDIGRGDK